MEFGHIAHELLKEVVDRGRIREDTAAYRVALKYMAVGYTSLKPTQQPIYYLQLKPHLTKMGDERKIAQCLQGISA